MVGRGGRVRWTNLLINPDRVLEWADLEALFWEARFDHQCVHGVFKGLQKHFADNIHLIGVPWVEQYVVVN